MTTFTSIETATRAYYSAGREARRLQRDLSGCDWCCGGGDAALAYERAAQRDAVAYLGQEGVKVPEAIDECDVCNYADVETEHTDKHGWKYRLCNRCYSSIQGE